MIMHPVNLGVAVPGGAGIRGIPGITGTEDRPPLSIWLLGDRVNTARLPLKPFAALGEGQEPESAAVKREAEEDWGR